MILLLQAQTWTEWSLHLVREINTAIWGSMDGMLTGFFGRLPYLLAGVIVLAVFWLISRIVKRAVLAAGSRASMDVQLRLLMARILAGVIIVLGILTAMSVVVPSFSFGSLVAGLGFTSVIVGFAAKDIVNNFLSGILILWQRPFRIGDYVFVGANQGKVELIGVRATSLRKDDGEMILIPNGDMYSGALMIRGKGSKRRMSLKVEVGFAEDIARVKKIIHDTIAGAKGVVAQPAPTAIATDLSAAGVTITANFWLNTTESSPLEVYDRVLRGVLDALKAENIRVFSGGQPPPATAAHPPPSVASKPILD